LCGIFGIVKATEDNLGILLSGAGKRLSYRGYDSVGCATINQNGVIDLRKDVGKIDDVAEILNFSEMIGSRGIVQLRWATFGHPSPENAQPHIDSDGDLVGAHNGNVVNNIELRERFLQEGMTIRSTNDGESCVHAVERYFDQGSSIIEALRLAYNDLEGDYAFVIGHAHDDRLYAVKNGSGLAIGIGDNFTCVSSDIPSILPLTRRVIQVYDGEIVELFSHCVNIYSIETGAMIERQEELIKESMESVQKGGYAHFMLKEIHEQEVVASEVISLLDHSSQVDIIADTLNSSKSIFLSGCGTSFHACILGAIYMAQIAGKAAVPVLAPQFIPQYGMTLSADDTGVFVSQSGETKDVLNAVKVAQKSRMTTYGIVNVIGSSLAQVSNQTLPLACGYEISVPATKTFLNQTIVFLYLAMRMAGLQTTSLSLLPTLIKDTLDSTSRLLDDIETEMIDWGDSYCLGYGKTYPIALEGALKLKEITYSHCEGMLSTEFKHGPLSAVTEGYPVIYITSQEDIPIVISGINEVTCRGGNAIVIGPEDSRLRNNANHLIPIPDTDSRLFPILSVLPLQLLSYRLSLLKGINPDFPRNLSKTLTVD
jgi:glucosamine--fructose-6-phosphate aminotransferase (isomerizing)